MPCTQRCQSGELSDNVIENIKSKGFAVHVVSNKPFSAEPEHLTSQIVGINGRNAFNVDGSVSSSVRAHIRPSKTCLNQLALSTRDGSVHTTRVSSEQERQTIARAFIESVAQRTVESAAERVQCQQCRCQFDKLAMDAKIECKPCNA